MSILYLIICLALGYLIGSIPFGVVLARVFNLGDLRQIGSGNIGATNVLRTGSKKAAILTLLLDALKGTVAVWIGFSLGGPMGGALAGLAAFLGHCFPVWLGFKGGKGVATFMGVLLALNLTAFFTFCAVWLIVAALTKYSSAAALAASSLALIPVFIGSGFLAALPVLVMIALLWWRHGENITRLRAGTESRISFGGSK